MVKYNSFPPSPTRSVCRSSDMSNYPCSRWEGISTQRNWTKLYCYYTRGYWSSVSAFGGNNVYFRALFVGHKIILYYVKMCSRLEPTKIIWRYVAGWRSVYTTLREDKSKQYILVFVIMIIQHGPSDFV